MPLGATLTIEFQATIDVGVAPGQDITNTGTAWYSSLDGASVYERDGETAPACLWGGRLIVTVTHWSPRND